MVCVRNSLDIVLRHQLSVAFLQHTSLDLFFYGVFEGFRNLLRCLEMKVTIKLDMLLNIIPNKSHTTLRTLTTLRTFVEDIALISEIDGPSSR